MATPSIDGSAPASRKGYILFEERDDLWWLTGSSLKRANALLGLRCMGATAGFEPATAFCYAKLLVEKGLQVDLRRGEKAYNLNNRFQERRPVMSRVLWLNPGVLLPGGYCSEVAKTFTLSDGTVRMVGAVILRPHGTVGNVNKASSCP